MIRIALVWCALTACSLDAPNGSGSSCTGPDPTVCPVCPDDVSRDDYGTCGGENYSCDAETGQWVVAGYCEPFPLSVKGDVMLAETVTVQSAACTDLELPPTLVLTFVDESTVTAGAPITVTSGDWHNTEPRFASAQVALQVGATTVAYDLTFSYDGTITGTATGTNDAAGCNETLAITGSFEPAWGP